MWTWRRLTANRAKRSIGDRPSTRRRAATAAARASTSARTASTTRSTADCASCNARPASSAARTAPRSARPGRSASRRWTTCAAPAAGADGVTPCGLPSRGGPRPSGRSQYRDAIGPDTLGKVYVEPTNACNLNCTTCVRHAWDEREGFMEWATFEAVVDGFGEAVLHPRFVDMVRLATKRGLRSEVTTNALLLDQAMADELVAVGLGQLVVSIDGASAEAFGRVRSGASLARVIENVRHLHDQREYSDGPRVRIGLEFV